MAPQRPRPAAEPPAVEGEVQALVAATWAVAARAGNIEPSVREILVEAGLSTKAFYRHFRSKDDLLLLAFDEGTRRLVEYLEHRMSASVDPFVNIAEWVEGYVRQAAPPVARHVLPWSVGIGRMAVHFPDNFRDNQAAMVEPLHREIDGAVRSGRAHSPDPEQDAWIIFGYTDEALRRHLIHDTAPDRRTVDQLVTFAFRALGRSPAVG